MAIVTSNQLSSLRERYEATNGIEAALGNQSNNIYTDSEDSGQGVVDELTGQLNTSEYDGAPDSKFVTNPDQISAIVKEKGIERTSPLSTTIKNKHYDQQGPIPQEPFTNEFPSSEYDPLTDSSDLAHTRRRGGEEEIKDEQSFLDDIEKNNYNPQDPNGGYLSQFYSNTGTFQWQRPNAQRTIRASELGGITSS